MRKPRHFRVVLAATLVLGCLLWWIQTPRAVRPLVTLGIITNSLGQLSNGAVFRITNADARAILLTDLIVETNSPAGWRAFSHKVPTHPQRLATGETKDLDMTSPNSDEAWRLRVTYGKDVKGLALFLGKAEYAISQRAWPGKGFGIMAGSNSCISEVMTR